MFNLRKQPAAKLRLLMAAKDINTQELADLTGLSPTTISRIRSGIVKRPKSETAYRIASALGVKVNSIWRDM
ncbi:helix-turn-helix domain-containing protein (plasmid) [Alicyclobacillus acidoterrestris]|uniref:helix-turn-helix domain-containing protein n=1 Tax=Alicyclobacillus acidoterrestris TaxID=1450 RepID=UPI003F52A18B